MINLTWESERWGRDKWNERKCPEMGSKTYKNWSRRRRSSKVLVSFNERAFKILPYQEAYINALFQCECNARWVFCFHKKSKTEILKTETKTFLISISKKRWCLRRLLSLKVSKSYLTRHVKNVILHGTPWSTASSGLNDDDEVFLKWEESFWITVQCKEVNAGKIIWNGEIIWS